MGGAAQHILIPFHDFARGGTERIALTLARQWLDAGRRVTVLCGSKGGGTLDLADPRLTIVELDPPLPRSTLSRLWLGRRMATRLADLQPDAVFIPGNFHFVIARAFKRAAPNLPLIAKVSNPLLPPLPGVLRCAARLGLAAYVRPIDQLVYMAEELAQQGRADLPRLSPVVIAEPNLPRDRQPVARTAPQDPPLILAIGRMEPQKNLSLALEAFALLLKRRPARLLILGEGAERASLEAQVTRLGIGAQVAMPGYSTTVAQHLAQASALLLSSRYEGYPAVVVEALAADVPVVACDCTPCLPTLLATPQHGRIVPQNDPLALAQALEATLDQPFTSQGLRPASVAHHDEQASATAYLASFDALANKALHRARASA